jgi:hypothetical protein
MRTYDTFDEAQAAAGENDTVCGAYKGDTPVYFLADKDASEDEMRHTAFAAVHGRPMSSYEDWLLEMARLQREHQVPA